MQPRVGPMHPRSSAAMQSPEKRHDTCLHRHLHTLHPARRGVRHGSERPGAQTVDGAFRRPPLQAGFRHAAVPDHQHRDVGFVGSADGMARHRLVCAASHDRAFRASRGRRRRFLRPTATVDMDRPQVARDRRQTQQLADAGFLAPRWRCLRRGCDRLRHRRANGSSTAGGKGTQGRRLRTARPPGWVLPSLDPARARSGDR